MYGLQDGHLSSTYTGNYQKRGVFVHFFKTYEESSA